jgi:hypothetical protein
MKLQKLSSIILCLCSLIIVHSAYSKTCFRLELEGSDYIQKFTSVTENQNIYFIIKDEKVLFKALNQEDFLNFQDQLTKVGSCSRFEDLKLGNGCYPIMSHEGSYILSSDFVIFDKSEYRANWSDMSHELKILMNSGKCLSISQLDFDGNGGKNFCSLNIKNANDNKCHLNCAPEIRVSKRDKFPAVEVLDTSSVYLSRYEYKKHVNNIGFYVEQSFCHEFSNFGQQCAVLTSQAKKDEFLVRVPNFATYSFGAHSSSSTPLKAMIELSLGGVCKSWESERKINFNSLGSTHRHYFSFNVSGLKHQALDLNSFKKFFNELTESKILGVQEPLFCQIVKSDKGFSIQREESVIFWSDTEVEAIKAMIELGKLNLCKFKY